MLSETSPAGMCIEIRYVLLSIPERALKHPLRGCVLKLCSFECFNNSVSETSPTGMCIEIQEQ